MKIDLEQHNFGQDDASFQAAGGIEGITDLVARFYVVMNTAPEAAVIRAMHPEDLTVTEDKLARFLCGWLGGPRRFDERYGPISIPRAHSHLVVNEPERDAWLFCMQRALEQVDYSPEFKRYLLRQLAVPAERIRASARD